MVSTKTRRRDHAAIVVRWIAVQSDSSAISALLPLLGASERALADRFHMVADRDAYIAAHVLLRSTLSCSADVRPADWRFTTAASGKPSLDPDQNPSDLHFSVTHTRGLAACAVGSPCELGIDAEAWREPAPIELAARYFAPCEARLVEERLPVDQSATFYRLWTLKEAYLKATGQGLAASLNIFAFSLDPVAITVAAPDAGAEWQFAEFQPGPAHSLALAVRSKAPISIDAASVSPLNIVDRAREEHCFQ
jgi:4'-phosphopantetheinyl transferase